MTQKTIYFKEPNTTIRKTSSNVHDLLFQEGGLQVEGNRLRVPDKCFWRLRLLHNWHFIFRPVDLAKRGSKRNGGWVISFGLTKPTNFVGNKILRQNVFC